MFFLFMSTLNMTLNVKINIKKNKNRMKPCRSIKISIHFVFCLVCCGSTLQANTLCKYKIEKFKRETCEKKKYNRLCFAEKQQLADRR